MNTTNRNVHRGTFDESNGTKQVSLTKSNYCEADHKGLAVQYGIKECPSCGRKTHGQMKLGDY